MEEILRQILGELGSLKEGQEKLAGRMDALGDGQGKLVGRMDALEEGQKKLIGRMDALGKGQEEIKTQLGYMWDDIKKLDGRLSKQEEETFVLKRMR